nr:hypothetical protein [Armatimonas sp.]
MIQSLQRHLNPNLAEWVKSRSAATISLSTILYPLPGKGTREEQMVLQMDVLVHVPLQSCEAIQKRSECPAGLWRCDVAAGEGTELLQRITRRLMLRFHRCNGFG